MKKQYTIPCTILCLFTVFLAHAQQRSGLPAQPYLHTAKPTRLFIASESYTPSEKVALQTLMGVIAQTKPEIIRDLSGHPALAAAAGVAIDSSYYQDLSGLLKHYRKRLKGYILCNVKDRSTNVAISLAGVLQGVAIPADIEQTAIKAGLTRLQDVRGRDEQWLLDNYDHLFNRNTAVYQNSSDNRVLFLADYTTYTKSVQFWDDSPSGPLATHVYSRMNKGASFFGWGPEEYKTVEQLSQRSMMIIPSDWAPNLSVLTNIPALQKKFHQKPPVQQFEVKPNVHTVCFVITDGDNVQWLLGSLYNKKTWNNPNRSLLNLGWTIAPTLIELAPSLYQRFIDSCTTSAIGRNVLIAGPSGRAYYLPGRYPKADLDTECVRLNQYMKKADLRIVNIIDADNSDNDPSAYLKQNNIDALFYYSYGRNYTGRRGKIDWYNGKPSIGGRLTLWGDMMPPKKLAGILNQSSTDIHAEEGYSLISVHIWSRTPDDVLNCIQQLGPNVRVVPPDEFVWLIKQNLQPTSKQ